MAVKFKIKKGDSVIVVAGRDKGKKGSVLKMLPKDNRAIVQGVNVAKRHTKQSAQTQGGIVSKEMPIHISNLAHVDPCRQQADPGRLQGARRRQPRARGQAVGGGDRCLT
jgi:large subunit ribosomal protein L24